MKEQKKKKKFVKHVAVLSKVVPLWQIQVAKKRNDDTMNT